MPTYVNATEAARLLTAAGHTMTRQRVCKLADQRRIPGAKKRGTNWEIPLLAPAATLMNQGQPIRIRAGKKPGRPKGSVKARLNPQPGKSLVRQD